VDRGEQVANLYAAVLKAAREGRTVYYSDIAPLAALSMKNPPHRKEIGALLELITLAEASSGRPMLSSLVVAKEHESPGPGFHPLAVRLGRPQPGETERAFLKREQKAAWDTWRP
jgi:hypothetical protein